MDMGTILVAAVFLVALVLGMVKQGDWWLPTGRSVRHLAAVLVGAVLVGAALVATAMAAGEGAGEWILAIGGNLLVAALWFDLSRGQPLAGNLFAAAVPAVMVGAMLAAGWVTEGSDLLTVPFLGMVVGPLLASALDRGSRVGALRPADTQGSDLR